MLFYAESDAEHVEGDAPTSSSPLTSTTSPGATPTTHAVLRERGIHNKECDSLDTNGANDAVRLTPEMTQFLSNAVSVKRATKMQVRRLLHLHASAASASDAKIQQFGPNGFGTELFGIPPLPEQFYRGSVRDRMRRKQFYPSQTALDAIFKAHANSTRLHRNDALASGLVLEQFAKDGDVVQHVVRRGECACGANATRGSSSPVPTCVSEACTHFRMMFIAKVSDVLA